MLESVSLSGMVPIVVASFLVSVSGSSSLIKCTSACWLVALERGGSFARLLDGIVEQPAVALTFLVDDPCQLGQPFVVFFDPHPVYTGTYVVGI